MFIYFLLGIPWILILKGLYGKCKKWVINMKFWIFVLIVDLNLKLYLLVLSYCLSLIVLILDLSDVVNGIFVSSMTRKKSSMSHSLEIHVSFFLPVKMIASYQ